MFKKKIAQHFNLGIHLFTHRIWQLMKQPVFIVLTVVGNTLIAIASALLYYFESGVNPKINSLLDTLWWAVATVTTVGYGDISPITTFGKIIGIFMMIVGTALFWCYTALFAGAIMAEEASEIIAGENTKRATHND
jgi:voltage-gated potassium channel